MIKPKHIICFASFFLFCGSAFAGEKEELQLNSKRITQYEISKENNFAASYIRNACDQTTEEEDHYASEE